MQDVLSLTCQFYLQYPENSLLYLPAVPSARIVLLCLTFCHLRLNMGNNVFEFVCARDWVGGTYFYSNIFFSFLTFWKLCRKKGLKLYLFLCISAVHFLIKFELLLLNYIFFDLQKNESLWAEMKLLNVCVWGVRVSFYLFQYWQSSSITTHSIPAMRNSNT